MKKEKQILIPNLKLSSISIDSFNLFLEALKNIPPKHINFTENLKRCSTIKLIEEAIEQEKETVEIGLSQFIVLLSAIDEMTINELSYELAAFWEVLVNKINE